MKDCYNFFKNKKCKYYPCHKNIKEMNCLFCYCPLYFINECGGNFKINKNGHKDCTECTLPHIPGKGYKYINKKLKEFLRGKNESSSINKI
jgi:Zn-finger protein